VGQDRHRAAHPPHALLTWPVRAGRANRLGWLPGPFTGCARYRLCLAWLTLRTDLASWTDEDVRVGRQSTPGAPGYSIMDRVRPCSPARRHAKPDRPRTLTGGFRGAVQNRIDGHEALTTVPAGQSF
jgi:hypothetical protein